MTHKVWYQSKTLLVTILSLLATLIASPAILNIIPAKYLVYIPAAAVVIQSVLRAIPTDAQGGITITQGAADTKNANADPVATNVVPVKG